MGMSMAAMEAWKKKLEAVDDIFTVIDSAINVAAWYRPNDFLERRDRIAEKLYVRQPIRGGYCGTQNDDDDDDDDSLDMDLNDGDVDWLNGIVSELVKDFALDTEEELGDYFSDSEIDHRDDHHRYDHDLPIPTHGKGKQLSLVESALLQSPKRKRSTESEHKKEEQCSVPQAIAKCPRQSTEISKISEPAKSPKRKRSTASENKKDEQCSVPQAIAKCPRRSTEISKISALLQSPKRKRSTKSENKKDEQCSVPQAIAKCPRQRTEISKISEPAKAKVKEHKSTCFNDAEAYELKMEATKRKLQQRYKQIERAKKKIRVVQA
ncbi:hypothetical protein CsSME_00018805 [Camellia sinensis var. sinensis]